MTTRKLPPVVGEPHTFGPLKLPPPSEGETYTFYPGPLFGEVPDAPTHTITVTGIDKVEEPLITLARAAVSGPCPAEVKYGDYTMLVRPASPFFPKETVSKRRKFAR
jgi:hypothetical protein